MKFKTLGVWFGFDHSLSLKREGIGRVFYYLIRHLIINYDINCEIWCYEINAAEVNEMFAEVLNDVRFSSKLKVFTEVNCPYVISRFNAFIRSFYLILNIFLVGNKFAWKQPYHSYLNIIKGRSSVGEKFRSNSFLNIDLLISMLLLLFGGIARFFRKFIFRNVVLSQTIASLYNTKNDKDTLADLANKSSSAECFMVYIVTLRNALQLRFPKLVFLPDLVTLEFYDYFIEQDPNSKTWIQFGKESAEDFAKQGAYFCGISRYGIVNQFFKYINNAIPKNATYIYLASMSPSDLEERVLPNDKILGKFNLRNPYVFFPSHIRGYKNVLTLIKAIGIVNQSGINAQLVLTGKLEHDKAAFTYVQENNLQSYVVECGDISETDLYSLYKHAAVIVSPSLFEGGFPLQGLEAFLLNTPVILAKISVTVERLQYHGFDPDNCGVKLFDAKDHNQLALLIAEVIDNRDKIVLAQQDVKNTILSYTWDNVSEQYFSTFQTIINGRGFLLNEKEF